jgi:hypothetical protein
MPENDASANMTDEERSLDLPAQMFRSGENPEPTTLVMERRVVGPVNVDARFTVVDDLAVFEGDIVLGSPDDVRSGDELARAIIIVGERFRWPRGVVPYAITDEVVRPRVEAAIAHWQQHTPFRFVVRTNQRNYISFERHNGCWSRVGRQGGKQVISLAAGCSVGAAIHEIGHALGLWHEQSRSDRDDFIEIVWENIDPQQRHNFDKHVLDGDDLGPYDYGSIMHYPATAFSINGQPTIRARGGQPIGQRNGLSAGDIAGIKLAYPNLSWPTADAATGRPGTAPRPG